MIGAALAVAAGAVALAALVGRRGAPAELVSVTGRPGIPPLARRAGVPPDAVVTLVWRLAGAPGEKHVGARVVGRQAAPGLEYTGLLLDSVWEGLPAGAFVEFGARHVAAIGT